MNIIILVVTKLFNIQYNTFSYSITTILAERYQIQQNIVNMLSSV